MLSRYRLLRETLDARQNTERASCHQTAEPEWIQQLHEQSARSVVGVQPDPRALRHRLDQRLDRELGELFAHAPRVLRKGCDEPGARNIFRDFLDAAAPAPFRDRALVPDTRRSTPGARDQLDVADFRA